MPVLTKVRRAVVGPVIAAVTALICTAILYVTYFDRENDVQRGGITMITQAAVDRAGATAVPTESTAQPARSN